MIVNVTNKPCLIINTTDCVEYDNTNLLIYKYSYFNNIIEFV